MNANTNHHTQLDRYAASMWAKFWPNLDMPEVVITLARKNQAAGWYCPDRLSTRDGKMADEIALNPQYVFERSRADVVSTIAHELVHLWQQHYGKPGKRTYHNRQWADEMKRIGLQPVGHDGKETGHKMSHDIIPGGIFDTWFSKYVLTEPDWIYGDAIITAASSGNNDGNSDGDSSNDGGSDSEIEPKSKPKSKVKFTCPQCGANVWGKPSSNVICGDCFTVDNPMSAWAAVMLPND